MAEVFSTSWGVLGASPIGNAAFAVQKGDELLGWQSLYSNVSGGSVTASLQYWKEGKAIAGPDGQATFEISEADPPGNKLVISADADQAVLTFSEVTVPAATLHISLERS